MKTRIANVLSSLLLLLFVVIIFIVVFALSSCSSTPKTPCPEPEIKIVVQKQAVPCIVPIEPLEELILPPIPPWPHDADEDEMKAWVTALGEALEERVKIFEARDRSYAEKIKNNNRLLPKCSDVSPVP